MQSLTSLIYYLFFYFSFPSPIFSSYTFHLKIFPSDVFPIVYFFLSFIFSNAISHFSCSYFIFFSLVSFFPFCSYPVYVKVALKYFSCSLSFVSYFHLFFLMQFLTSFSHFILSFLVSISHILFLSFLR